MKWKLCSCGRLYQPERERAVYFDPGSGDTHLISILACAVLRILREAPLEIDEIATRLQAAGIGPCQDLLQLEALLDELSTVDLVEIV